MSPLPAAPWRPGREDMRALLLIALLPLLVASPQLIGLLKADPALYLSQLTLDLQPGVVKTGAPYIDPNSGYNTQSLGVLAAWHWLNGMVPWWNHYTGLGMPLAGEYQGGAFFPLTFLLLLPYGMAWLQVSLQILAGLGTYGLLRQLGLARTAATAGALLYAFNGTLAWFAHAPASPVPFLPFMLWGIERIAFAARVGGRGGWALLAAAMAMSLLASFPETAYLNGLLALAWTVLRGFQLPAGARPRYALGVAAGGLVGIAIAAPQVYAFFDFLRHADLGGHDQNFAHATLQVTSMLQSLVAPYALGPIFSFWAPEREWINYVWGGIGGYVTLALLVAALAGFWSRRDALSWMLLAWFAATVWRTFFAFSAPAWNLIPGVSLAAFYRYAAPSWELALVILAARGLDAWARETMPARAVRPVAWAVMAAGLALGAGIYFVHFWPLVRDTPGLRNWGRIALVIAAIAAAIVAHRAGRGPGAARLAAVVLVAEAVLMFAIPTLSNPRGGQVDAKAIGFLRDNLGFNRFYTLGPLQPNYGAMHRLASINYNVLPNTRKWFRFVQDNLDRKVDSVVYNGLRGGVPSAAQELKALRPMYEEIGVRYVLTFPNTNPFAPDDPVRRVYQDPVVDIYELAGAKPYFESAAGRCKLDAPLRSKVFADCSGPDRLVRRELSYPGWTATVGGRDARVEEYLELYQSVRLPAGRSEVRFDYAPPHAGWAWLAALAGILAFAASRVRRR